MLLFVSCACAIDYMQTKGVSEWYIFILLIQPQSNSLYPGGVIYVDKIFGDPIWNANKPKCNKSNKAIFRKE